MNFLKKKKKLFYTVDLSKLISKRPPLSRLTQEDIKKSKMQFKCPHCECTQDNILLNHKAKCCLCGLVMHRVDLFKLKCEKD